MGNNFSLKKKIFKNASTTYYYSSIFFTHETKKDVFTLYAYVRYADDLIDNDTPNIKEFKELRAKTKTAFEGKKTGHPIIDDFAELAKRKNFDPAWTWAFLDAMESDLEVKRYKTYADLQKYMHGSAEVIGLFMSRIFDTPEEAFPYAMAQGEAMQFINFIRDIDEDHKLGRQYMPVKDVKKFRTTIPPRNDAEIEGFKKLVRYEIDRYKKVQSKADKGHPYIKRRFRIMVKTSAGMYNWTAREIEKDPMIVFEKKVKPKKWYVILSALWYAITA